ncbi:aminodeoxychorismate/anthranilate synthase component II [Deinococcus sp. HMF7620]|uniref:Aminodeoxychorismate/anthranilate synthase component II n=1 Tax=Deinococcus arboris TaxID=2682977 RepID=A0A7C9LLD8_9DEIO|nr:aminodeoxychorismate/anthranilate synthase component II [Deinococcus arboris]MVN86497.1 aminodeoxychorismate/anthranilate synthase component II [Deinococcus arboris]
MTHNPHPTTRLLLIDNYDSFTYNLVQYFGELGCDLTVWRNDAFTLDEVRALNPDAIVVSPGPCTPAEAGQSVAVIRELGSTYPLLGVCLGHQSIGAAFGAQVGRARQPVHGKTSPVRHDGADLFAGLPDGVTVTRYHSLVVRDLPPELVATAWTTDPEEEIVMALRHREYPVYGVQFHPESVATQSGMDMLRNFLTAVREHQAMRGQQAEGRGA